MRMCSRPDSPFPKPPYPDSPFPFSPSLFVNGRFFKLVCTFQLRTLPLQAPPSPLKNTATIPLFTVVIFFLFPAKSAETWTFQNCQRCLPMDVMTDNVKQSSVEQCLRKPTHVSGKRPEAMKCKNVPGVFPQH